MATYASLIDVGDRSIQNAQELAAVWGELRNEFADHDADLLESYAITGERDFLVLFETDDREGATRSALTLHERGLSAQTIEIRDTDEFATLVDEV